MLEPQSGRRSLDLDGVRSDRQSISLLAWGTTVQLTIPLRGFRLKNVGTEIELKPAITDFSSSFLQRSKLRHSPISVHPTTRRPRSMRCKRCKESRDNIGASAMNWVWVSSFTAPQETPAGRSPVTFDEAVNKCLQVPTQSTNRSSRWGPNCALNPPMMPCPV